MPPAARATQQVTRSGLTPVYSAVDNVNGESFPNNGSTTFLVVKNAGGVACTVSITKSGTPQIDGDVTAAKTVVVPSGTGEKWIGPFPPNIYNDANQNVIVGYSTGTSVTAAVITLG